ncbi:hypothetical protein [Spirosoma endbachense]|uniref:Uncharacterized protein n=1 Tax=Spirosoma endbachense TaxID=2666025 RepID=A0A6P1W2D3_9BACT|nr:hypothetical protein [Spirosoma endbachense]QHV99205.1 hypothetical protein GJR95_31200 [Spirosoma endbachense]
MNNLTKLMELQDLEARIKTLSDAALEALNGLIIGILNAEDDTDFILLGIRKVIFEMIGEVDVAKLPQLQTVILQEMGNRKELTSSQAFIYVKAFGSWDFVKISDEPELTRLINLFSKILRRLKEKQS